MRTKRYIQAANYYAFLGDVRMFAQRGATWETLPLRDLHKRHHIGGWPKDLLRGFDLLAPVTMDRAQALIAMAADYNRHLKATRDERDAHRKPADPAPAPAMPEMVAMKELVEDTFGKLPEVVAVEDDATLPLMTDREMIAALTRHGYIVCKPVQL